MIEWVQDPRSETHEACLCLVDKSGWWDVFVKFDGCVHIRAYSNAARDDQHKLPSPLREDSTDYMHICDLDEFIAGLQALRAAAVQHFGEGWPE
jgi:hypothetical protein